MTHAPTPETCLGGGVGLAYLGAVVEGGEREEKGGNVSACLKLVKATTQHTLARGTGSPSRIQRHREILRE